MVSQKRWWHSGFLIMPLCIVLISRRCASMLHVACCSFVVQLYVSVLFCYKVTNDPLRSSSTIMMAICYLPPARIKFPAYGGPKLGNDSAPIRAIRERFGIWIVTDLHNTYWRPVLTRTFLTLEWDVIQIRIYIYVWEWLTFHLLASVNGFPYNI